MKEAIYMAVNQKFLEITLKSDFKEVFKQGQIVPYMKI